MTFRAYLFFMAMASALAWFSWFMVLNTVDPREAGTAGFAMFYLTLGISLLGLFALLGALFRVKVLKREALPIREVKISFRHAILLSTLAVGTLFMSRHDWLRWWTLLLFIVIAALVEVVALVIQKSHRG